MSDTEIRRGDEASRLLNEPMLREAFETVEARIVEAMKLSSVGDEKTHHELVVSLQCLGKVRGWIKEQMETGKLALIHKESLSDKAKRLIRRA